MACYTNFIILNKMENLFLNQLMQNSDFKDLIFLPFALNYEIKENT